MAWAYKVTLTVAHGQCGSSNSTDFPVLVSLTNPLLKVTGSGGQITSSGTQSGGGAVTMPFDLIFTSDSAGTTKIPWEFEKYVTTTGEIVVWVKVATLSASVDTVFYLWFGDAAVGTQQNTSTMSPANVWNSNFAAVYHLADGTTLKLSDSTSNSNTLTNLNTVTAAAGQIDGAANFVAVSAQRLTNVSATGINFQLNSSWSLSAWIKSASNGANKQIICNGAYGAQTGFCFLIAPSGKLGIAVVSASGGSNYKSVESSINVDDNTWRHCVATYDGSGGASGFRLYINGSLDASSTITNDGSPGTLASSAIVVGGLAPIGSQEFNGQIDEPRVIGSQMSADWILSEYNNQIAPGTFLSASFAANSSGTTLTPGLQAIALTKYAAKLIHTFAIPKAALSITGKVAKLAFTVKVPKASLALTGKIAKLALTLPVPKATLAITGQVPVLNSLIPVVLRPAKAPLNLTGKTAKLAYTINVPKGTLTIAGKLPAMLSTGPVVLLPGGVAISITGRVPLVLALMPAQSLRRIFRVDLAGESGDLFRSDVAVTSSLFRHQEPVGGEPPLFDAMTVNFDDASGNFDEGNI